VGASYGYGGSESIAASPYSGYNDADGGAAGYYGNSHRQDELGGSSSGASGRPSYGTEHGGGRGAAAGRPPLHASPAYYGSGYGGGMGAPLATSSSYQGGGPSSRGSVTSEGGGDAAGGYSSPLAGNSHYTPSRSGEEGGDGEVGAVEGSDAAITAPSYSHNDGGAYGAGPAVSDARASGSTHSASPHQDSDGAGSQRPVPPGP
jgi:hypothetical protein